MKRFTLLALLFILIAVSANAQNVREAKPKLFANFPEKILCTDQELSRVFIADTNTDKKINLTFSDHFIFNGTIVSSINKYSNLQTVILRSLEFDNIIFSISKITNSDNSITYTGRMINSKYADGYALKKDTLNSTYQLVKFETEKLLQNCLLQ